MRSGSFSVNPYEVLGVSQDASYAEIQAAYRQHALRWHPDRNANDDYAYRMMLRVNAAWAILKDEESRAAYDRWEQRGESRSESGTRGWSHRERDAESSHGGGAYRPPGPPPPSVMTCARCDSTNEVGSVYCYSCGYPFDEGDRRRDSSAQVNREQRAQKANSRSGLPAESGQRLCAFFIDAFIVLVLSSFTVSFLLNWYDLPDEPFFWGKVRVDIPGGAGFVFHCLGCCLGYHAGQADFRVAGGSYGWIEGGFRPSFIAMRVQRDVAFDHQRSGDRVP